MRLDAKPLLETTDLDDARQHLSNYLWPHALSLTEPDSRLAFRHRLAKVGRVSIHSLRYGAPVRIDARPTDSYLFLVLTSGIGLVEQDGVTNPLDALGAHPLNPSSDAVMEFSPEESNLTVRIPGEVFRNWLRRETGEALLEPLCFDSNWSDGEAADADIDALRGYLDYLCGEFNRGSPCLQQPSVVRQLENTLVGLVLSSLPHNYSRAMRVDNAAPPYVAVAERYIAEHSGDALTLADMAAVAGVSERSLQAAFRRFRDTTPMEYLRDCRLEKARRRLKQAAANNESVTNVAMACGFNHLGKFAQIYRARFGEAPSETRRRSRAPKDD
ncbi:MAG: AraC family transcriptional regulator [Gammaproteobacteria bacterium]|nr:AraC family transcriptional regulator [Gammaproteobacteria bacterium]